MNQNYSVALNSDRVHISLNNTPVQTILFNTYVDKDCLIEAAKNIAVGVAVVKAIYLNDGKPVIIAVK